MEHAEGPLRSRGGRPHSQPARRQHDQHRQDHPQRRREDDRDQRLVEPIPLDSGEARMGHSGSDDPANQGMARRGGQALEPRDDVPEHRSDQRPEHHGRSHQVLVDQALADRVGDLVQLRHGEREKISSEVEESGECHGLRGAQQARGDDRRDRIGGIVQPVQEVERERDGDEANQQR